MQIVIDIPDDEYQRTMQHYKQFPRDLSRYERRIIDGTPLPKGHGALIDREELRNKYASWYNLAINKSINAVLTLELYQIEPIIQADSRWENNAE